MSSARFLPFSRRRQSILWISFGGGQIKTPLPLYSGWVRQSRYLVRSTRQISRYAQQLGFRRIIQAVPDRQEFIALVVVPVRG